jgi:hypothetical protein
VRPDASRPPKGKLDGGNSNEGGQVSARSPVAGQRTKPLLSLENLTISMRKTGILATTASICWAVVTAVQLVDLGQSAILAQQIGQRAALKPLTMQAPLAARR